MDSVGDIFPPALGALGLETTQIVASGRAEVGSGSSPSYPLPVSLLSYVMPSCESDARAKSAEVEDPFKDRELPGRRRHCLLLTSSPLPVPPPTHRAEAAPASGSVSSSVSWGGDGQWAGAWQEPQDRHPVWYVSLISPEALNTWFLLLALPFFIFKMYRFSTFPLRINAFPHSITQLLKFDT